MGYKEHTYHPNILLVYPSASQLNFSPTCSTTQIVGHKLLLINIYSPSKYHHNGQLKLYLSNKSKVGKVYGTVWITCFSKLVNRDINCFCKRNMNIPKSTTVKVNKGKRLKGIALSGQVINWSSKNFEMQKKEQNNIQILKQCKALLLLKCNVTYAKRKTMEQFLPYLHHRKNRLRTN